MIFYFIYIKTFFVSYWWCLRLHQTKMRFHHTNGGVDFDQIATQINSYKTFYVAYRNKYVTYFEREKMLKTVKLSLLAVVVATAVSPSRLRVILLRRQRQN